MKKSIFITFAAVAALASCSKEGNQMTPEQVAGPTITIHANTEAIATRTGMAADMKTVEWKADDKMAVIIMKGENQFGHATEFTKAETADAFTGTFTNPEDGPAETGLNTYYAIHPFSKDISTIHYDGKRNTLAKADGKEYSMTILPGTQIGLDNMKHIRIPFVGKGTVDGKGEPDVMMKHTAAIFKVTVTNPGKTELNIKSVRLEVDGKEKLSGNYKVNVDGDYPLLASGSAGNNFAELFVKDAIIPAGGKGDFYVMTSRVRLNSESQCTKMTIEVKTNKEIVTIVKPVDCVNEPLIFSEGQIHSTVVDFKDAQPLDLSLEIPAKIDFEADQSIREYMTIEGDPNDIKAVTTNKPNRLKITNDAKLIIPTKSTPSTIVIVALEENKPKAGTPEEMAVKATFNVYGSTDGLVYEKIFTKNDLKNAKEDKSTGETLTISTSIKAGMKYFKFENVTPQKDNGDGTTGNMNNRCIGIISVDFQK